MKSAIAAGLVGVAVFGAANAEGHERFYVARLAGSHEEPPNGSAGTGFASIALDLDLITMHVEAHFEGLTGNTTIANLYGPTNVAGQGVAGPVTSGFTEFPMNVHSGVFDQTFDLTSADAYNATFVATSGGTISDALNRLIFALEDGTIYFNIRTTSYSGGEIRAFCVPPCPADFNHDDVADFFDYLDFVDAFSIGLENADFNHDETIDFFDYLDFVDAFSNGC